MNDSLWLKLPPHKIDRVVEWAKSLKLSYTCSHRMIGTGNVKSFHIIRITSKDPKVLTMASLFGDVMFYYDSEEICKK